MREVRAFAIACAGLLTLGCLLQVFIAWFLGFVFACDENCDPNQHPGVTPVIVVMVAGAILLTALGILGAIALSKAQVLIAASTAHLLLAVGLLAFWLYVSQHSDGTILWMTASYELPGCLSLVLFGLATARRTAQSQGEHRPDALWRHS